MAITKKQWKEVVLHIKTLRIAGKTEIFWKGNLILEACRVPHEDRYVLKIDRGYIGHSTLANEQQSLSSTKSFLTMLTNVFK